MNWETANSQILSNLSIGLGINTRNSSHRVILQIPPYQCNTFNYGKVEGFKVKIGSSENSTIEIPMSMLKSIYEASINNNGVFDNGVFVKLFAKQQIQHPCHVHVVGQIFVKAKLAKFDGSRKYTLI